jgi:hypothetical protein
LWAESGGGGRRGHRDAAKRRRLCAGARGLIRSFVARFGVLSVVFRAISKNIPNCKITTPNYYEHYVFGYILLSRYTGILATSITDRREC